MKKYFLCRNGSNEELVVMYKKNLHVVTFLIDWYGEVYQKEENIWNLKQYYNEYREITKKEANNFIKKRFEKIKKNIDEAIKETEWI